MGIQEKARTLAAGAGVALATTGLSTCNNNGAVDPPPPPLECNAVDQGESLTATGVLAGAELQVTIRNSSFSQWTAVSVTAVVGGSARPVALGEPLVVVIDLADPSVTEGGFHLSGTLSSDKACAVSRNFAFRIQPDGVVVAFARDLPLAARQQARIALLGRDGYDVHLEAVTPFHGTAALTWNVTGGEIVRREDARMHWRLPQEPGLYQAEVVVDYGPSGLSFDTLAIEVS